MVQLRTHQPTNPLFRVLNDLFYLATLKGPGTAQIGEGGDNTWHVIDSIDEDMTDSDDVTIVDVKTRTDSRASNTEKKSNSQGENER